MRVRLPPALLPIPPIARDIQAFLLDDPCDVAFGIFSLHTGQQGCCPEDIALSSAFDDKNSCGIGFIVRTVFTKNLELTGFVPLEINTICSNHSLPLKTIYAIKLIEKQLT